MRWFSKWNLLGTLRIRVTRDSVQVGYIYYYLFENEKGKRRYEAHFTDASFSSYEKYNYVYADQVVAFINGQDVSAFYYDNYGEKMGLMILAVKTFRN